MLLPLRYKELSAQKGSSIRTVGLNTLGFFRQDALSALAALGDSSIAVLGGDVYIVEETTVRTTRDSWHVQRRPSESLNDYLYRTRDAARIFVETYADWKTASPKLAALNAKGVYIEKYSQKPVNESSILFTFALSELGVTPVVS